MPAPQEGNVASANDWRSVLEPVVGRYRKLDIRWFFRGEAAFAFPELYEYLEPEAYLYAIHRRPTRCSDVSSSCC